MKKTDFPPQNKTGIATFVGVGRMSGWEPRNCLAGLEDVTGQLWNTWDPMEHPSANWESWGRRFGQSRIGCGVVSPESARGGRHWVRWASGPTLGPSIHSWQLPLPPRQWLRGHRDKDILPSSPYQERAWQGMRMTLYSQAGFQIALVAAGYKLQHSAGNWGQSSVVWLSCDCTKTRAGCSSQACLILGLSCTKHS